MIRIILRTQSIVKKKRTVKQCVFLHLLNLFDESGNNIFFSDLFDDFAFFNEDGFADAAGNADVGFERFTGAVDRTAHQCDLDILLQKPCFSGCVLKRADKRNKVNLHSAAGGTGDDIHASACIEVERRKNIMRKENVDVSITGNSTNPTHFQHPVAGTYKKWCNENGVNYFSVASGDGTGRTLQPDNMAAGPASYGMTDTMGRMHSDAQFAGSSSVPAHVEMMGLIGAGNNLRLGMTVAVAVAIEEACK